MSINQQGIFLRNAIPAWKKPDDIQLPPLVIPDGRGPWAIRYLWIKHRENNQAFIENYFNGGNNVGYNVRKQTTHLQEAWNPHNDIHIKSGENGNLVWRVKVLNKYAQSIDYVEIWRSPLILKELWGVRSSENPNGRSAEDIETLRAGLYEAGFEIRTWQNDVTGWPLVSKLRAMGWYKHFIERFNAKDGCIINTPWKRELNPILG